MHEVIFISDKISEEGIRFLEEKEYEVIHGYSLTRSDWNFVLPTINAWILESESRIDGETLKFTKNLKIIGRAGAGVDNIDIDAATRKGIVVENSPGGNSNAVAEHTIAMMLAISRRIPQCTELLRNGEWNRCDFIGVELKGKTLGLIGLGKIGSRVAQLARAIGMEVIAYDPYVSDAVFENLKVQSGSFKKLLKESDFISLHIPLNEETADLIDKQAISRMKDGVYLVNCARGGLINEVDLLNGLSSGKVAGAALDGFASEPPDKDNPLLSHENVISTPHMGGITFESRKHVTLQVCEQIHEFFNAGKLINTVNFPFADVTTFNRMKPLLDLSERIGKCLSVLSAGRLEQIEVHVSGEIEDIRPITGALLAGFLKPVSEEYVNIINAYSIAQDSGIRIKEEIDPEPGQYRNFIRAISRYGSTVHSIDGTVFADQVPRMVHIDNYDIEVILEGNIILLHVEDKPGVIGKIGTTLGKHDRNILEFRLGRIKNEPIALTALNVDGEITNDLKADLRSIPEVVELNIVENL